MIYRPLALFVVAFVATPAFPQSPASPTPTPALRSNTTIEVEATTDDETISLGAIGRDIDLKKIPFSLTVVSSMRRVRSKWGR